MIPQTELKGVNKGEECLHKLVSDISVLQQNDFNVLKCRLLPYYTVSSLVCKVTLPIKTEGYFKT